MCFKISDDILFMTSLMWCFVSAKRLIRDLSESNSKVVEHCSPISVHKFMLAVCMYIIFNHMQCFRVLHPGVSHESFVSSRYAHKLKGLSAYQEKTTTSGSIPGYATSEYCISILYHAIENTVANTIIATCVVLVGN